MLAAVGGGKRTNHAGRRDQFGGEGFVDDRGTKRTLECAGRIERDAVERDEVRGSDEQGRIVGTGRGCRAVCVRRNGTGEHDPRVGHDDRVDAA